MTGVTDAAPFVKWIGGKRQLLSRIIPRLPVEYNSYHEPFVGGGAVFFAERPANAFLNDINTQLVQCYKAIKTSPQEVIGATGKIDAEYMTLSNEDARKDFYYARRADFNECIRTSSEDTILVASLFMFLNRHCFNGLYRVNKKGFYNAAFNRARCASFDSGIINADSAVLEHATITNNDFLQALEKVEPGDFVFIDSPYVPINASSFESYARGGFTIEQHKALAAEFSRLDKLGAKLMLTNHDTDLVRTLYDGYNIEIVDVKRAVNRDGKARTGQEVIITNGYANRRQHENKSDSTNNSVG